MPITSECNFGRYGIVELFFKKVKMRTKMRFYAIATFIVALLGSTNMMSQSNTQYYFLGYIYSRGNAQALNKSKVYPYLPVELRMADNPDKVLAVKVSNGNGEVSFKGVPIDQFKDYYFDILGLETSNLRYEMKGTKEPYRFPSGNLTTHMRLPKEIRSYYTTDEYLFGKNEEETLLLELLQKHVGLSYEDGSFFSEEGDLPYKLLINGRADFNERKFVPMLPQLSGGLIKSVTIIKYTNPNQYYEGAIDLHLTLGIITDRSTVKTELLNYSIQQVK